MSGVTVVPTDNTSVADMPVLSDLDSPFQYVLFTHNMVNVDSTVCLKYMICY